MGHEFKQVLFSDGEGLAFADLNNMQRYLMAQIWDFGYAARIHTNEEDEESAQDLTQAYCLRGASILSGAGARQITIGRGGVLFQLTNSQLTGDTPKLLAYHVTLSSTEFDYTTAVGDATNPRIDIISYKIEEDDTNAADNATRDFKDATTGAVTSQTFVKKRRTKLTTQLTAGTPAATPAEPATPAGFVKWGAVFVPALHNAVHTPGNLRDYRYPMNRYTSTTYCFANGPGCNIESGWTAHASGGLTSAGAADVVRVFPMSEFAHHAARLISIEVVGNLSTATVELVRRAQDTVIGSNTDTVLATLTTNFNNGLNQRNQANFNTNANNGPWWGNGYGAGNAAKLSSIAPPNDPRMTTLCLKITSGAAAKTLRYVRFNWAAI